jgi:hypothetical protein
MFTKICNTWSNGYPFFDITKYVVDGVISLNILTHSLMWWCFSFIPIILISPWSLLSSWPWSFGSSSSSWLSWSRPCVGRVVSFGKVSWDWLLGSYGLTSPITIFCKASHEASSSSMRSRSTCSFWEPLVSSNTASHVVSTQPVVTLKIRYAWEFES